MMIATGSGTEEEQKLSAMADRFCRRFSLAEIQLATQNFSEEHVIGIGGFGKVYVAQIDNGEESVAIKRLATNSNQGAQEFVTEIETLSKLRHINLVSLIGYCNENGEMILVYEYISGGTLADNLYKLSRSSDCQSLTWKQRLSICTGAARGLDYLHSGISIIHRDVKSTNILLDENFRAKVSDFGLAKHLSTINPKSHVSTIVKGSFGYIDPSYFTTCRLTRQSDTYAFGVVLLEVLCGRPAVDPRLGEDEMSLVMWAQEKISRGKVEQIVASNLREEITADCLKIFVAVAKKCLNLDPKKRPTMSQVVAKLEYAHDQLERRPQTLNAVRFLPFRNRVKISGSRAAESDHKNVDLKAAPQEEESKDEQMLPAARAIPIQELKDVTGNFSSKHLIGEGSSGRVYHGVLKTGQVAAIKKLIYNRLPNRMFLAQVPKATKLKHENVAQLLGHCVDGGQQYLAYEFAQYGSLHDILHGQPDTDGASKPVSSLSWANRVKIAIWAAQGLEYIHHQKQTHCNIKSTNILLFDDYKLAKLADLGRLTPHSYDEAVADDKPPRRPEYMQKTSLRWRTDVYCFGVVLLELLTGGEVVDYRRPTGQHHIVKWATPRLTGDRLKEIVDARLNGDYPPKEVAKMASIAFSCVQYEAQSRPYMSKVVNDLCSL